MLSTSVVVAIAVTSLLALVWDFSLNHKSARLLYPPSLILVICFFEGFVGLGLAWWELRKRPSFSVMIYPILAVLFALGCWGFTELLTYDYALARDNPLLKAQGARNEIGSLSPDSPSRGNKVFTGALGERFEYDPRLSMDYDLGRSMNKVAFNYKEQPVGALFITAPPPNGVIDDILVDVIVESTKKNSRASVVEHDKFKNRSGCEFHHFSCDAQGQAEQFRYELFLHIAEPVASDSDNATKRKYFGMYKFEFLFPAAETSDLVPMLEKVVDSFTPNESK